MIGFGGHRETASVLTSPTAAGKSPRPVAQGKDGKFPLLWLSNSEENLTPNLDEARCEEGRSVPIDWPSSLRLSFPRSQTSTARPRQESHLLYNSVSFSDYFIQAPLF